MQTLLLAYALLFADVPPPSEQIAVAMLAAPQDRREGAGILGYDATGKLVTLRAATNDLLCLADNPKIEGVEVDCYHKELEPSWRAGASWPPKA